MIRKGLAVAVIILFIGVAVAPNINADFDKSDLELEEEDVTPTPFFLAFQLITKLRNYKDIENVETEGDVLRIIEGDEELNSMYEQLSVEDCGCEDDTTSLEWRFPVICMLLFPMFVIGVMVYMMGQVDLLLVIVLVIGMPLNCRWIP